MIRVDDTDTGIGSGKWYMSGPAFNASKQHGSVDRSGQWRALVIRYDSNKDQNNQVFNNIEIFCTKLYLFPN
jgi:hypothetical protein